MMNQVFEIPTQETLFGSKSNSVEEIKEPNSVPYELSHILSFTEYKNIVMSCKSEIEAKKSYRIIMIVPIIIVSIIFGILFAKNIASHLFLIIGLVIFIVLYIIVSIYLFSKWNSRFDDKLEELNNIYSNKGIRIEKKIHYSYRKRRNGSTIKIYIYYTAPFNSQIGIVIPPPPPMYILNNHHQQQQQQQQQQNQLQPHQIQSPRTTFNIIYDKQVDTILSNYNISIDPQPLLQQKQQQQQQQQLNEHTPLIK